MTEPTPAPPFYCTCLCPQTTHTGPGGHCVAPECAQEECLSMDAFRAQQHEQGEHAFCGPEHDAPAPDGGLRERIAAALEAADYRMDMRRGDLRQRAVRAEAAVRRVRQMARAWQQQLPETIRRDTAADALLTATEALAHLDSPATPTP